MRRVRDPGRRARSFLVLAALAALACGPANRGPAREPQPPPDETTGGPDAELASCRAGDAASCLVYAREAPESPWTDRSYAWHRACDLGEPVGCCVAELGRSRGDEEFEDAALQACRTGCAAGDLEACAGLGKILAHDLLPVADEPLLLSYCSAERDVGCEWFGMPLFLYDDAPLLMETFRRACEAGGAHGCLMLARALEANDARDEAEAPLRTACESGVPEGCAELGELLGARDREPEAIPVLRTACRASLPEACNDVANLLESVGRGDEVGEALREGCDADPGWSCEIFAGYVLDVDGPHAAAAPARRACEEAGRCRSLAEVAEALGTADALVAEYRDACDHDDALACLRLGSLLEELAHASGEDVPGRAEESAAAWRRGCGLGLPAACTLVGDWQDDLSEESRRLDAETFYRVYCEEGTRRLCLYRLEHARDSGRSLGALAALFRKRCEAGDADPSCSLVGWFDDEGGYAP